MTHTPGPWVLHEDRVLVLGAGPNRQAVVDCATSCSPNLRKSEREANARLIAAAPELLAFAIEMEDWLYNHGNDEGGRDLLRMVRAAIAKAEGR